MSSSFQSLAFALLLVPAMGCGGATTDGVADAHDTDATPDAGNGYPAGMIAATGEAGLLSFFTYDTPTGFTPIGNLSGGSWAIGVCAGALAFDSGRNLYIGCEGNSEQPVGRIFEFASGSVGDAQPIRSVTSPELATGSLSNIAVDSGGNIYVVAQGYVDDAGISMDSLLVFGPSSDTAPIRTIQGGPAASSILLDSSAVAFDPGGNVYVASVVGPIEEFSAGANGAALPLRSFSPADGYTGETGLAIDSSGRIYVTAYADPNPTVTPASLLVFGPDGAVERTIGGPGTGMALEAGMAIDGAGRIYVGDLPSAAGGGIGLRVFAAGASGNVAPEATLAGVGEIGFAVAP